MRASARAGFAYFACARRINAYQLGRTVLRLADTSIRLYRRRDWAVSVRLHSYLMIHAKGGGFRLSTYLNEFDCSLILPTGEVVAMDEYGFTYDCLYEMEHMIHEFWASGRTTMDSIQDGAARLRIVYRLFSYAGQGNPSVIDQVVPVLARGVRAQRWARASESCSLTPPSSGQ